MDRYLLSPVWLFHPLLHAGYPGATVLSPATSRAHSGCGSGRTKGGSLRTRARSPSGATRRPSHCGKPSCASPAAGPSPGGGDERRSTPHFQPRLSDSATERSSDGQVLSVTAGPARADEGDGPDAGRLSKVGHYRILHLTPSPWLRC